MKIFLYREDSFNAYAHCLNTLRKIQFTVQHSNEIRGIIHGIKHHSTAAKSSFLDLRIQKLLNGFRIDIYSDSISGSSSALSLDNVNENEFVEEFIDTLQTENPDNAFKLREQQQLLAIVK